MMRPWSVRTRLGTSVLFGAVGLAVAGCDNLDSVTGSDAAPAAALSADRGVLRIEERDVEAPDVFALRDRGLWDGRPSLGGIWVAVPQSVEPDRVRITNRESGREVVGGLFRKETEASGPAILVSADAAAALGMQAGTPAVLDLVVLRRETVEILPPPPVTPLPPEGATVLAGESEPATVVAAAEDTDAGDTEVAGEAAAVAAAATAALVDAAPAPAATEPLELDITETALEPAPSIEKPYVQVATVDDAVAANDIVRTLQGDGIASELRITADGDRRFFSVVVGPAKTEEERDDALSRIRDLGYDDAFAV
ncbi:MAG: SPOR domain-containing protein [Pseudomonadota bacterium]